MDRQQCTVDEDEGSLPQGKVNRQTGKIERSADALQVSRPEFSTMNQNSLFQWRFTISVYI
jgi:hypothetical protein